MRKNMKLTRIFQNISIAVIITALGLTSCDYLDVVPPEQPNICLLYTSDAADEL